MSSPQQQAAAGPSPAEDKKKGLEKYVAKFKKALGRTNSTAGATKGQSTSATSSSPAPSTPSSTNPATAAAPAKNVTKQDDHKIEIAKKAGIDPATIDAIDLGAASERVEKKIRLRVHRTCHECQGEFGKERICPKCSHKRCSQCTRFPEKKSKKKAANGAAAPVAAAAAATEKPAQKSLITKPGRCGGQDLVHKKPTQRVRRNCHACDTLFMSGSKECAKCEHVRCADCPRDPPKKSRYPYGYPHDQPGQNPFYECHDCQTVFEQDSATCAKCQHNKCDQCTVTKPRKVPERHDPDVVRSVEEKLARLGLGGSAPIAA